MPLWTTVASLLAISILARSQLTDAAEIVAIVHPENQVSALSLKELGAIYKMSRRKWDSGVVISPLLPPPDSAESAVLTSEIFGFSSRVEVARFYLRAVFQQRIPSPPATVSDTAGLVQRVAADEGAIGIVDPGQLTSRSGVRVVEILREGRR